MCHPQPALLTFPVLLVLPLVVLAQPAQMAEAPELSTLLRDDFEGRENLGTDWVVVDNEWAVAKGRLRSRGDTEPEEHYPRPECWAEGCPVSDVVEVTATVTVSDRTTKEAWAAGGIAIGTGQEDFWHLALVEGAGPDLERYAELVEMRGGRWQAQQEGPTALPACEDNGWVGQIEWETGVAYVLSLRLGPDRVVGEVLDTAGAVLFHNCYALNGAQDAVREGRLGLVNHCVDMGFDDITVRGAAPGGRSPERGAVLPNGNAAWTKEYTWAFDWPDTPGAEQYHVIVQHEGARVPWVDELVPQSEFRDVSTSYVADANLLNWKWRFRAQVNGVWQPWSEEWTFSVEPMEE